VSAGVGECRSRGGSAGERRCGLCGAGERGAVECKGSK